eukprot:CAMPEP_0198264132 /NCGR_PEP_ID=MMETSP1447-20131203/14904_1 /TAXON_ID=420782 /ORGANISM="Chaetoceros dichaeta, Strain CCMP1751" /LENGTH=220 /DNA_ID=CAMNT_0043952983 /DNA_START=26 /DNA_END=688 /DNA_ORIENTATION=-
MAAKLYYYAATGKANQIRLAMAASDIEWEEVNATGFPPTPDDTKLWIETGGNTTTNVPMVVLADGTVFTQSSAVIRAIARRGGLMPSSEDQLYLTDKLLADADSLRDESYKCFVTWGAEQELADNFIAKVLPLHLGNIERQLIEGGKEFFVGDEMSIADLSLYDAVTSFGSGRVPGDALEAFPQLKEFVHRVASNPKIAAYLAGPIYSALLKFGPESLGK